MNPDDFPSFRVIFDPKLKLILKELNSFQLKRYIMGLIYKEEITVMYSNVKDSILIQSLI